MRTRTGIDIAVTKGDSPTVYTSADSVSLYGNANNPSEKVLAVVDCKNHDLVNEVHEGDIVSLEAFGQKVTGRVSELKIYESSMCGLDDHLRITRFKLEHL